MTETYVYISPQRRRKGATLFASKRDLSLSDTPFSDLSRPDQMIWIMRAELEEFVDNQQEIIDRVDIEKAARDLYNEQGYINVNDSCWMDIVYGALDKYDPED